MITLKRDRSAAFVTDGDALLSQSVISQSIANKRLTESVTDVTGFCIKRPNAHARIGELCIYLSRSVICHTSPPG